MTSPCDGCGIKSLALTSGLAGICCLLSGADLIQGADGGSAVGGVGLSFCGVALLCFAVFLFTREKR